jgi:hypothetical protein
MKAMKAVLAALLAVALVAIWSGGADATGSKGKAKPRATHMSKAKAAKPKPFDENAYYERVLRFVPFGTAAWWRQLEAENAHQD